MTQVATSGPDQAHARCGGSVLSRRIVCTASLLVEDELPNTGSEAAKTGTRAHALTEVCLDQRIDACDYQILDENDPVIDDDGVLSYEMIDHIQGVLDHIRETAVDPAFLHTESRVDTQRYVPDPQGAWATMDVGYYDATTRTLYEWDLKYGHTPVSAKNNAQLRICALGFIDAWGWLYDIEHVVTSIVMPLTGSITRENLTVQELRDWADVEVTPKILEGLDPDKRTFTPGESQCHFCRANGICVAQREYLDDKALEGFSETGEPQLKDLELLTDRERVALYPHLPAAIKWCKSLSEHVEKRAIEGTLDVPMHKLVHAQSRRRFKNDVDAKALRECGLKASDLHENKLRTVAQLEKLVPAKLKEEFGELWEKPEGRLKLVPDSHKGKAVALNDGFAASLPAPVVNEDDW